jgi:hypothetical protein
MYCGINAARKASKKTREAKQKRHYRRNKSFMQFDRDAASNTYRRDIGRVKSDNSASKPATDHTIHIVSGVRGKD